MEVAELRVTAYWGPLVTLVNGREGILFTCSQIKLGWSQNIFYTPVGFTLTQDKIHGMRGESTVKLTSEILSKLGQFPLIIEGSTLTALLGTGSKMLVIGSKTIKLRASKL